jgi:hypothetical protein
LFDFDREEFELVVRFKGAEPLEVVVHHSLDGVHRDQQWILLLLLNSFEILVGKQIGMPGYLGAHHDGEVTIVELLYRNEFEPESALVLCLDQHNRRVVRHPVKIEIKKQIITYTIF